jgi:hypothetical protein
MVLNAFVYVTLYFYLRASTYINKCLIKSIISKTDFTPHSCTNPLKYLFIYEINSFLIVTTLAIQKKLCQVSDYYLK